MLPNFLNLGVSKCGTTWLYRVLDSHPSVYVTQKRKEVHFFCNHYEKGIEWYKRFFPESGSYQAVGEVATHYLLTHNESARRIADVDEIERLIVILRDPVERARSHYDWVTRFDDSKTSLKEKAEEVPMIVDSGFYATGIKEYLKYYDMDEILILVSENCFNNVEDTKSQVAQFLEVDVNNFREGVGSNNVNKLKKPRFYTLYKYANKISYMLRMKDMGWVSNLVKMTGLKKVLISNERADRYKLSEDERQWLIDLYSEEVEFLSNELGVDTSPWVNFEG